VRLCHKHNTTTFLMVLIGLPTNSRELAFRQSYAFSGPPLK